MTFLHPLSLWRNLITPPVGEEENPAFITWVGHDMLLGPLAPSDRRRPGPGDDAPRRGPPASGLRAECPLPRVQLFSLWHELLKFPAAWPHTAGGKIRLKPHPCPEPGPGHHANAGHQGGPRLRPGQGAGPFASLEAPPWGGKVTVSCLRNSRMGPSPGDWRRDVPAFQGLS